MALLSTAFMTATGGRGLSLDKRDVNSLLMAIMLKDTAFINQIKYAGTINNTKCEWIEDSLNSTTFTGKVSTVSTTIILCAAISSTLRQYSVVQPVGTEIAYQLTAAPTAATSVAVTRYGNDTNATHTSTAAGATFQIIANPHMDIADASSDISKQRTVRWNSTQVIERAIEIEKSRSGIDFYAVNDELKKQTMNRTLEAKVELNISFISGKPRTGTTYLPTEDSQLRTTGGFIHRMINPTMASAAVSTMASAIATLNVANMNAVAAAIYSAGGFDEKSDMCIMAGPDQARAIGQLNLTNTRYAQDSSKVGVFANRFITDLGFDVPVYVDRHWPSDKIGWVDKARIDYVTLKDDNWSLEKMAKTGRSQKYQLSGQFGLRIYNADAAHFLMYNVS